MLKCVLPFVSEQSDLQDSVMTYLYLHCTQPEACLHVSGSKVRLCKSEMLY